MHLVGLYTYCSFYLSPSETHSVICTGDFTFTLVNPNEIFVHYMNYRLFPVKPSTELKHVHVSYYCNDKKYTDSTTDGRNKELWPGVF